MVSFGENSSRQQRSLKALSDFPEISSSKEYLAEILVKDRTYSDNPKFKYWVVGGGEPKHAIASHIINNSGNRSLKIILTNNTEYLRYKFNDPTLEVKWLVARELLRLNFKKAKEVSMIPVLPTQGKLLRACRNQMIDMDTKKIYTSLVSTQNTSQRLHELINVYASTGKLIVFTHGVSDNWDSGVDYRLYAYSKTIKEYFEKTKKSLASSGTLLLTEYQSRKTGMVGREYDISTFWEKWKRKSQKPAARFPEMISYGSLLDHITKLVTSFNSAYASEVRPYLEHSLIEDMHPWLKEIGMEIKKDTQEIYENLRTVLYSLFLIQAADPGILLVEYPRDALWRISLYFLQQRINQSRTIERD